MSDSFSENFINDISLPNPNTNVNDENNNLPLLELQHNIKYLLNLISASSNTSTNLLTQIYGNLLDYDSSGKRVFFNGGNFDCFEKKQQWLAVNDGAIVNDTDIQTSGAENLLVYKGDVSYVDTEGEHGIYLQREFFIPSYLRGSELVLAIKGSGIYLENDGDDVEFDYVIPFCDSSEIPNISAVGTPDCESGSGSPGITCVPDVSSSNCYARYEDIGVEILGSSDTVEEIKVIGPWPHHDSYVPNSDWGPKYRTIYVPFKVGQNTSNIKVRIRRTRADGAIALSQIFLGGLPRPFEEYSFNNIDINELYDFINGITKWNVTTVDGHHVSENANYRKLPDLMTYEQWSNVSQFNRNIEEFDWDQESGPRPNELELITDNGSIIPKTHGYEFDPEFTRYCYFDMRVDGPDPGLAYLGISYFINENDFSDTVSCTTSSCGSIKFDVQVAVINPGDEGNSPTYNSFGYVVDIDPEAINGKMGYFEVYGDFYQNLNDNRGAIVYFIISRDGEDSSDTLGGNFVLVGCKTGLANPPDDKPDPGSYSNLFVGENNEC